MSENVLRLVSLFSGCGGMDKGFEDAGYQRVYANDFDPDAQAVFRLNMGGNRWQRHQKRSRRGDSRV